MRKLEIPEGYKIGPASRQIPEDAVKLVEQPSQNKKWMDLLAIMPDGTRLYVTTKWNVTNG